MSNTVHNDLSFDGMGINGPDQYRDRIATFTRDEYRKQYGPLFAAAPELLDELIELVKLADESGWHKSITGAAKQAITKAQGSSS